MRSKNELEDVLTGMEDGWGNSGCAAVDDFVSIWCDRLGTKVWDKQWDSNALTFQTEISSIRLRGMGHIPVIVVGGKDSEAKEAINQFKHQHWFGHQMSLALFATNSAHLTGSVALPRGKGVLLSRSEIGHILVNDDPIRELRLNILRQVPFRRLIPFTITHPAVGAMFFGREEELEMLIHENHVDYALSGPACIGKTSLLRQMQWNIRGQLDPRYRRIVEVDLYTCPADSATAGKIIAQRVRHTSYSDGLSLAELGPFLRRMRFTDSRFSGGPIELLIDEVDEVLAEDKRCGYPLLKVLVQAERADLIRTTLCGRQLPKTIFGDSENPLHQKLKLTDLGLLHWDEARNLLALPLDHLEVQLTDRKEILNKVLKACNRAPMRIQKWGLEIANRAAENPEHHFTMADFYEVEKEITA